MIATLALCLAAFAAPADAWTEDLDAALLDARASGRHVLVDITGSDWCPPCKALHAEVFSDPAFVAAASKHFVLVELDFPRRIRQAPEVAKANARWAKIFGVSGYPTVLMITPDQVEYGRRVGYQRGQSKAFKDWVNTRGAQVADIDAAWRAMSGDTVANDASAVTDGAAGGGAHGGSHVEATGTAGDTSRDRRLSGALKLVTLLGAESPQAVHDVLHELDPTDEHLGRAHLALADFEAGFSGRGEPNWRAMLRKGTAVAADVPSVERLGDHHAWMALAHHQVGERDQAEARLAKAREHDARDELLQWVGAIVGR